MSGCKDGDKVYISLRKGSGKCHIKVMQCHITCFENVTSKCIIVTSLCDM